MAGYKISIPKSVTFLLASQNNKLENIFEKDTFTVITKNVNNRRINLTRTLQDLYEDKCKF